MGDHGNVYSSHEIWDSNHQDKRTRVANRLSFISCMKWNKATEKQHPNTRTCTKAICAIGPNTTFLPNPDIESFRRSKLICNDHTNRTRPQPEKSRVISYTRTSEYWTGQAAEAVEQDASQADLSDEEQDARDLALWPKNGSMSFVPSLIVLRNLACRNIPLNSQVVVAATEEHGE